jgi:hypothetical protein
MSMVGRHNLRFGGVEADDGLVSDDLGAVHNAARDLDAIAGFENNLTPGNSQAKPAGEHCVHLVDPVRVVGEKCPGRKNVP